MYFCKLLKKMCNSGTCISRDPFKEGKELCWHYKDLWFYREVKILLNRAMNGVGNTIVHTCTLEDYTFCINRISVWLSKCFSNYMYLLNRINTTILKFEIY